MSFALSFDLKPLPNLKPISFFRTSKGCFLSIPDTRLGMRHPIISHTKKKFSRKP